MKNLKYFIVSIVLLGLLSGCDDFLGDNFDPDAVEKVPVDQIMPVVLFYSALENYDHAEYGVYLSQCLTTPGRSQTGAYAYRSGWEFMGMNRHPHWRRHFFDIGANANNLMHYAEEEGSVNYMAVTRLLRLLSVQQTTDAFGDMPLSDAYQSSAPKYDTQESIYEWMKQEVKDLIELFESPEVTQESNRLMGKGVDRVFSGDIQKWKQVLYAIKARILLRQIPNLNTDASTCNSIIEAAEKALSDWTEPFYGFDGGTAVEQNCMWGPHNRSVNTWESRKNDLFTAIPSKYFVENVLRYNVESKEFGDPRAEYLMKMRGDEDNDIDTVCRYLENNIGMPATHKIEWYPDLYECVLTQNTSSISLFSTSELHFIIAEAAYWGGDKEKASQHLIRGIRTHMERLGVSDEEATAYLNNPSLVSGSSNITLTDIMREKYIAMYLQPEQWTDLRRYAYSNDENNIQYNGEIIYPGLRRPHNLYEAYWSTPNEWVQRFNYDPETEEKYNRAELERLGAYRNPEWLKKPMIWGRSN